MKYSVGEVSKLLGITSNALRFYDQKKVLRTSREKNGRRFYEQTDIVRLLSCKKYSSMEIPLRTIAEQFSEGGDRKEAIAQRLNHYMVSAQKKAIFYQTLAENIALHMNAMEQIPALYGNIRMETSPECLFLFDSKDQLMTRDHVLRVEMKQWISAMPATRIASVYLSDDTKSGEATLAYSILSKQLAATTLDIRSSKVLIAPAGPSLHAVLSHYDFLTKPESIFSDMFAYMEEHGLRLHGNPWAQIIVVESDVHNTYHTFADVWVPIQSENKSFA